MPHATELDVRSIPPPQRHQQIFQTFDGLAIGEAFVLVNDHDPKPLLYQLQVERSARFDWNVLEAGPERYRVEIRRRTSETSRGVSECLGEDHRRLDAILGEAGNLVGAGDLAAARRLFAEFVCGLNRHIDIEELILFPAFERATGMAGGPTMVMRTEHREIRGILDAIARAIDDANTQVFDAAVRALVDVLSGHNMKEEQILYPMTDRAAGGDRERDDLVRRMQAY